MIFSLLLTTHLLFARLSNAILINQCIRQVSPCQAGPLLSDGAPFTSTLKFTMELDQTYLVGKRLIEKSRRIDQIVSGASRTDDQEARSVAQSTCEKTKARWIHNVGFCP